MQTGTGSTDPVRIKKISDRDLMIVWDDDHESHYIGPLLRGLCPCASCQDEDTGERLILPMHISDELTFSKIELVGHYAIQVLWSDGHRTGIYSFEYLRRLCQCEACRNGSGES